jgi:transposase-like protein
MVELVRRGVSARRVAQRFGVSHSTVRYWVRRAGQRRLDRVDWSDEPRGPHHPANRTDASKERLVLSVRHQLREHSDLGEYGAEAIHRELVRRGIDGLPSVRTIGRILDRHGALEARGRLRRPAPPRGWYLPEVAAQRAELDSFDFIEDLAIRGGTHFEVFTGISLWGGLPLARAIAERSAKTVVNCLIEHWSTFGLAAYAQFDNDLRFRGPHQYPDRIGRVIRLCLSLEVVPVFAPPQESGFQAAVEHLNGRWQTVVWQRFVHKSLGEIQRRSARYIRACRESRGVRVEAAPSRRPFPLDWRLDLQAAPRGMMIYLRRTDDRGRVRLLGHTFEVDRHWRHRLVRAEVNLDARRVSLYALRRREPSWQPLLAELDYEMPATSFME